MKKDKVIIYVYTGKDCICGNELKADGEKERGLCYECQQAKYAQLLKE